MVYSPALKFASLLFSLPAAVRGPVLHPPCMRQRPFAIAAALHGAPPRVRAFAPQRGAFPGSPTGLPLRNHAPWKRFRGSVGGGSDAISGRIDSVCFSLAYGETGSRYCVVI